MAIVGTVAVLTFSASLDRVLATPDRWGYGWDLLLDFNSGEIDAAAERIVGDERLTAVARWDAGFSYVEGRAVRAFGLAPLEGDIGYSLRSGRQPVSPGEVVLGPVTADQLGVRLGEQVLVAPESNSPDPAPVVVVGTALFPDDGEGSFGDGIGYLDDRVRGTRDRPRSLRGVPDRGAGGAGPRRRRRRRESERGVPRLGVVGREPAHAAG